MYHGSCLCQRIEYCLEGPLVELVHCHCAMCRKSHGAAFASFLNVRRTQLRWIKGLDALAEFASSGGVTRHFCMHCSSSLLWQSSNRPNWVSVAAASLDDCPSDVPQRHVYTQQRPDWISAIPTL